MPDAKHLGPAEDQPDDMFAKLAAELEKMPSQLDDIRPATSPPAPAETDAAEAEPAPEAIAEAPALVPAPSPAPAPPASVAAAPTSLPQPMPRVVDDPPPVRLKKPEPPGPKHFRTAGALSVGYWMSVGVGAVGQIASVGSLIASGLDGKMKILGYVAAAFGAAFAEITMIGAGSSSLKRRYAGGTWKSLLLIACLVCAYATSLNVLHWAPIQFGLAVMFGGGSLIGFAAHTMAEHLAAKDYEIRLAEYNAAVAERDAKIEAQAASRRRAEEKALRDAVKTVPQPSAEPAPVAAAPVKQTKPAQAKPSSTGVVDKQTAVQLGIARQARTPAMLKEALVKEGHELPASDTTIKNWCREIKQHIGQ
ncbi:hypothetical protein ACFORH_43065 [Amycolatopsis roodepoortensis]|uniref:Biotin carboxyl carrier protein n=1 Tax=Amycolatopsis roodepoortensis TaxID=700274 RepID=A0ABR9LIJ7_9PSEU|nr:hypothetical protein [Amycolatopsis roodepoortensis]MBE1580478.1 biotin carboxyl carrier protein [Amycolatopsis roodepoortensis]